MAPRQTVKFYGPIAAEMERVLKRPVKLESQRSFTDFTHALALHAYDIALIQPFDYPQIVEQEGYIPLARVSVPLVTQFYVRQDSPYYKLEDLRGTTIAMPPAKAANSRMALRALYDNKLIPGRNVEVRYFNSHDSCIQQVWLGNASACTTAPPPVKVFEHRMQAHLRHIYDTPPIPHVVFVADPRVPAEDREKLKQLFLGLDKNKRGRTILKNLGFPPFVAVKAGEYSIMRHYEAPASFMSAGTGRTSDLVMGIFPYLSSRQLVKNFAPLLPALTQAVEIPVRLQTASSYGSFSDQLATGKYDIVLIQPFEFEKAIQRGYIPLASMKNLVHGSFYVSRKSHYRNISEFKGKIIAMASAESALAYLGRHALLKAGLTPNRDVHIMYLNTHESCLREVLYMEAAACVTTPLMINALPKKFSRELRPLGQTEKIPGAVFLAHKRLSKIIREKLKHEILSWKDTQRGRKILNSMRLGSFVPVVPDAYRNISKMKQ